MSKKTRRHLSPAKKAELLRLHLSEKRPVSDICEEHQLQPSLFYTWLRQLTANAEVALVGGGGRSSRREEDVLRARIEALEAKLAKKDTVIAEVTEELVKTKKELGDL